MRHEEHEDRPGQLFRWAVRAVVGGMIGLLQRVDLPPSRAALSLGAAARVDGVSP